MSDVSPPPQPERTDRKKQIVGAAVTLVTLVLVFGIVFPQFADYGEAWRAVQQMTAVALVLLLAMAVLNIVVYVWPYQASLPGLSYGPGFIVRQTSFMISNVIPAGGAFGLAVQYAMLGSYGFDAAATTAAIGITSAFNTFVTLSLPVLGAITLVALGQGTGTAYLLAMVGIVVVGITVLVLMLIFKSESSARRLGSWGDGAVAWLFGLAHREPSFSVTDWVVAFRASTVETITSRWARITVTNYFQQIMQFLILWAAVSAIQGGSSVPVTFGETFVAYAFGRLASFIPVTPGGLGTVDAAITGILSAFGAANSDALAAVMVWRALTYFPQVFLGVGTYLFWRRRRSSHA
jgi:uncharacterized protein (TIRG00374 family)